MGSFKHDNKFRGRGFFFLISEKPQASQEGPAPRVSLAKDFVGKVARD